MASEAFDLTAENNEQVESDSVTLGAGERVLVRFTKRYAELPEGSVQLKIISNGVTSFVPIDDLLAWVTGALLAGSECSVVLSAGAGKSANIEGIIECGA